MLECAHRVIESLFVNGAHVWFSHNGACTVHAAYAVAAAGRAEEGLCAVCRVPCAVCYISAVCRPAWREPYVSTVVCSIAPMAGRAAATSFGGAHPENPSGFS